MAFRSVKSAAYDLVRDRSSSLKRLADESRTAMAAGPVSANAIKQLYEFFIDAKAKLTEASAVPGIADYAKAQEGDASYNVAAEFTAMLSAIQGVIDWIVANVPTNSGYVLTETWDASGVRVRTFSAAATVGLRTALSSFEATVE